MFAPAGGLKIAPPKKLAFHICLGAKCAELEVWIGEISHRLFYYGLKKALVMLTLCPAA